MAEMFATEVHIDQVRDGFEYKGHVYFGDEWKFNYEMKCDSNIGDLDRLAESDLDAAKRQMHLTITNPEGKPLRVPSEVMPLFEGLIFPLAAVFYSNPQTRASNKGQCGELLRGGGPLADFGVKMSIGLTTNHSFEKDKLTPALEKIAIAGLGKQP